jgi:uncharacterized protein YcfJ
MERPVLVGALLVAGAVASIAAVAGLVAATRPEFARVVDVAPVTTRVTVKEQQCADPRTARQAAKAGAPQDRHRVAGTVIGGMVGGVIGHQFGNGTGRTLATVAGAGGGAYAGNQVQKAMQEAKAVPANGRHCRIVKRTEDKVVAYDVRYRLDGKLGKVRMDYEPGERIPVRDGKLVLSAPKERPDGEA